jgi:hypothetical protein
MVKHLGGGTKREEGRGKRWRNEVDDMHGHKGMGEVDDMHGHKGMTVNHALELYQGRKKKKQGNILNTQGKLRRLCVTNHSSSKRQETGTQMNDVTNLIWGSKSKKKKRRGTRKDL